MVDGGSVAVAAPHSRAPHPTNPIHTAKNKAQHNCTPQNTHAHKQNSLKPRPFVARSEADVLAARGVKPSLSPSLEVLATVEALAPEVKRLLFIGVGCQVGVSWFIGAVAAAVECS